MKFPSPIVDKANHTDNYNRKAVNEHDVTIYGYLTPGGTIQDGFESLGAASEDASDNGLDGAPLFSERRIVTQCGRSQLRRKETL